MPRIKAIATFLTILQLVANCKVYSDSDVRRVKTERLQILPPDLTNKDPEVEELQAVTSPLPSESIDCFLGKDKYCTKITLTIRHTLKKAILEECASCSEDERIDAGYVLSSLIFHHPDVWQKMLSRYAGASQRIYAGHQL